MRTAASAVKLLLVALVSSKKTLDHLEFVEKFCYVRLNKAL